MVDSLFNSLKEIKETIDKKNPNISSFTFRNLPPQMGIPLGNFLRHILLDYLSGVAPLAVEISDRNGPVKSLGSDKIIEAVVPSLVGMDVMLPWLILRLKDLILVEKEGVKEGIFCLEMKVENKEKKERIITAGDFLESKQVEIKNPELQLAVLSPPLDGVPSKLTLKLYCQKNWGYHQVKERSEQEEVKEKVKKYFPTADNIIVPDANYSPIELVSFHKEEMKVNPPEEKLTITIESKGGISPSEALKQALEIVKNLLTKVDARWGKK